MSTTDTPDGYFLARARRTFARAGAPEAYPSAAAAWAQAAKGRGQRTGGVLVTADGTIVCEWHHSRGTGTAPGGSWVDAADMQRLIGPGWLGNELGLAQARIGRTLGEPVVALGASELTCGPAA